MDAVFRTKIANAIVGDLPTLVSRETVLPQVADTKAHAVIGMRRAGKTCYLHQHLRQRLGEGVERDRLVYFNFEDERLAGLEAKDMGRVLDEYYRLRPHYRHCERVTFCLDEVQTVPGWESFLRRVLDEEKVEVLFSGSSARLLSREIATQMRGRSMETVITPYSFREFLAATDREPVAEGEPVGARRRSELERAFGDYLDIGGFPEAVHMPLPERIRLLQGYVDIVLFRDMVERHGIANRPALRALTRQLL
jgi:predicted AAA+ superfamily ATPase